MLTLVVVFLLQTIFIWLEYIATSVMEHLSRGLNKPAGAFCGEPGDLPNLAQLECCIILVLYSSSKRPRLPSGKGARAKQNKMRNVSVKVGN